VNSRQRNLFIAFSIVGGALGLWGPWLLGGTLRFAGVGIPAGILAALIVYLITCPLRARREKAGGDGTPILLIALLSAIIAHFVESQSGIPITVTRTYFWVYAALLTVVGLSIQGERVLALPTARPAPASRGGSRRKGKKRQATMSCLSVKGMIMMRKAPTEIALPNKDVTLSVTLSVTP